MEEMEFKIQDVLEILKSKWKIIIGIAMGLVLIVSIVVFCVLDPVYESNSKIFIGKEESGDSNYNSNDVEMYQKLLKTYSELLKTKDWVAIAINKNNLNVEPLDVVNNLEVTPMIETQILQVSYKNTNNELSQKVLVAVINEFIKETKELIPNGSVRVIEKPEIPEQPISSNQYANIAIAFIIGGMIGIGIALLMEYIDNTLKTKDQTEKLIELPVIGMIPCEDKN